MTLQFRTWCQDLDIEVPVSKQETITVHFDPDVKNIVAKVAKPRAQYLIDNLGGCPVGLKLHQGHLGTEQGAIVPLCPETVAAITSFKEEFGELEKDFSDHFAKDFYQRNAESIARLKALCNSKKIAVPKAGWAMTAALFEEDAEKAADLGLFQTGIQTFRQLPIQFDWVLGVARRVDTYLKGVVHDINTTTKASKAFVKKVLEVPDTILKFDDLLSNQCGYDHVLPTLNIKYLADDIQELVNDNSYGYRGLDIQHFAEDLTRKLGERGVGEYFKLYLYDQKGEMETHLLTEFISPWDPMNSFVGVNANLTIDVDSLSI